MAKINILGIVTLFNPEQSLVLGNMERYAPHLEQLIVWDNSAESHADWFSAPNILYHWTGENRFIAAAVNFAWYHAEEKGFDLLLIMDQDSHWVDFAAFRKQAERCYQTYPDRVFCPHIPGNDCFRITEEIQPKKVFINSGTMIPIHILHAIGGADELFPLDALDYDLSHRVLDAGFDIVCLTSHKLIHTVGTVQRMGPFQIATTNLGPERTYSISRSFTLYYRRYRKQLPAAEKWFILREHFFLEVGRILLAEPQKWSRLKHLAKGMCDGLTSKLTTKHAK